MAVMRNKQLKPLDDFARWITKLEYRENQWHASFHPGKTVIAFSLETIATQLSRHVMHEIIWLCADALGTTVSQLTAKTRDRDRVDNRLAVANVLLNHFDHKINYGIMGQALGWANHCMIVHARDNAEVTEISNKIQRIYSRYPWLANSLEFKV